MAEAGRLERVVAHCKLATEGAVRRLLPGIEEEIPLLFKLGTDEGIIGEGFPVVPNEKLDADLRALVSREIAAHLERPTYKEDLLSPEAEEHLRAEPYVRLLSDLLVKAVSAGTLFKFENVIWLHLCERTCTALNADPVLNQLLEREPERYGRIKREVLASVTTRHKVANASLREIFRQTSESGWTSRVYDNPLNACLVENRLIFTERADSLLTPGSHRSVFLAKAYDLDPDIFDALFQLVQKALTHELSELDRGRPNPRNTFIREAFLGDTRLDQAEASVFALAHRDEVVQYVLYHLEPREFPRGLRRQLEDMNRLRELTRHVLEVLHDVVAWEFLNTLRGLVHEVELEAGVARMDGVQLSGRTVPITLNRDYIYDHNRWGTYVLFDIIGFSRRAREILSEYVALAIQNLFAIRRDRLAEFKGHPEFFEGDAVFESFERAIDAVRYISVFQDHYQDQLTIKQRMNEEPGKSPFSEGFRVGIGTGESFLISVFQGGALQGASREEFKRIGQVINLTSRLCTGKSGERFLQGPNAEDEPDPLKIFRAKIDRDGAFSNDGIVSLDSTFEELKTQVKEEGLKHVGGGPGRKSPFKHYEFELIYIDPVIDRIVLVRAIRNRPLLKGFENVKVRCFEYLVLKAAEFRELRRRDLALTKQAKAGLRSDEELTPLGGLADEAPVTNLPSISSGAVKHEEGS